MLIIDLIMGSFSKQIAVHLCDKSRSDFFFAVWAPHAAAVSVVGDFNNWDPDADPMKVLETSGIYEAFIPGLKEGELYKFAITTQSGKVLFKSDPYAFGS